MAKSSTTKSKPAPAPAPIRVAKTRLNKGHKEAIRDYMEKQFESRIDDSEINQTFAALLEAVNGILRAKYPEANMPTLRKYKLTRVDTCIRFSRTETGRLFYLRFEGQPDIQTRLADIACFGGCYNNDVFACDEKFETLADQWEKMGDDRARRIAEKRAEYRGFLEACRYLEEVEQIVPLSEEIRKTIGAQSRSLTVVNPEVLSRIKSDFAQMAAA
jgi:hypothetical protein